MPTEKSCGAVLFTEISGIRHYVLVSNEGRNNCALPKGRVEPGETEKETALREVWEETNIHAELIGDFRTKIEYIMPKGDLKQVVIFIARYENQTPKLNPDEHDEIMVLPLEEALEAISWDDMREVLRAADAYLDSVSH